MSGDDPFGQAKNHAQHMFGQRPGKGPGIAGNPNPIGQAIKGVANIDNGSGFIGPSDVNITFSVVDSNSSAAVITYLANITYSETKGATTTEIVSDLNLGNEGESTAACLTEIGTDEARCTYTWPAVTVSAITDGNYFIF